MWLDMCCIVAKIVEFYSLYIYPYYLLIGGSYQGPSKEFKIFIANFSQNFTVNKCRANIVKLSDVDWKWWHWQMAGEALAIQESLCLKLNFGWSISFLFRYVEEHVQRTGVAIETQGFTFVTSGRKRESLTVSMKFTVSWPEGLE